MLPCIYDEIDHKQLTKELIDYGRVIGKSIDSKSKYSLLHVLDFANAILLLSPMIKNKKFKEEKEWRLVTSPKDYFQAKFRQGDFSLLPYWELDLDLDNTLEKIIIGPTPEPNLSKDAIEGLLLSCSNDLHKKVKITHSEIPYRTI